MGKNESHGGRVWREPRASNLGNDPVHPGSRPYLLIQLNRMIDSQSGACVGWMGLQGKKAS